MEDYEAQEVEFWAKLDEEGMSRSSMLRRSAAAAFGLTIMGSASTALGATRAQLAAPPTRMTKAGLAALVKAAKKEGHLNTIALPPDWANY
jgi:putative spermidine/putrescine transport system substrate-binding protein